MLTSWEPQIFSNRSGLSQYPITCVCITSDKCYANRECDYAYQENDPLGGHDPYSASKAAAEIVISSYRKSFFNPDKGIPLFLYLQPGQEILLAVETGQKIELCRIVSELWLKEIQLRSGIRMQSVRGNLFWIHSSDICGSP